MANTNALHKHVIVKDIAEKKDIVPQKMTLRKKCCCVKTVVKKKDIIAQKISLRIEYSYDDYCKNWQDYLLEFLTREVVSPSIIILF